MPSVSEARALLAARVSGPSRRWTRFSLLLWLSIWLGIALAASAYSAVLGARLERCGLNTPGAVGAPGTTTTPIVP